MLDAVGVATSAWRARPGLVVLSLWSIGILAARWVASAAGLPLADSGTLARLAGASTTWFGAAIGVLVIASIFRGFTCRAALALACVLLAGGWFVSRVIELPASSLERLLDHDRLAEPATMTLRGVAEDWPQDSPAGRGSLGAFSRTEPTSTFTLRLEHAEDDRGIVSPMSGRVLVRVQELRANLPALLRPGAHLRLTGRVQVVRPAMNPGEPAWDLLARQGGRAGTLTIPSIELMQECASPDWPSAARAFIDRTRGNLHMGARRALDAATSQLETSATPSSPRDAQARALIGAMLLGERSEDLDDLSRAFARQGLLHLIAISGFNLVIMGGVALALIRLGGDRGWLEPAALAVLVALYMLVLPSDASILRSGFMMLALLLVEASGRRYDGASVMGYIGVGILAWRPMDLFSPGFQLSFLIVAVLLTLGNDARDRLFGAPIRGVLKSPVEPGPVKWWRFSRWQRALPHLRDLLKSHAAASLLAWGVATPIIALHSGVISPLAPLTSLIVLPLSVVLLWCGYAVLLVATLLPGLGADTCACAGVSRWCIRGCGVADR